MSGLMVNEKKFIFFPPIKNNSVLSSKNTDTDNLLQNIAIVGSGNVAYSLSKALKIKGLVISYVFVHNSANLKIVEKDLKIKTTSNYQDLMHCDLIIIAVNDDSIQEVASHLKDFQGLVVHTSGTKSLEVLGDCKRKGVLYPLQTMSKTCRVDLSATPILIYGTSTEDENLLRNFAAAISNKVFTCSDEQRKYIHLSAVFISNFVNVMLGIGNELLAENNLSFEIMEPLIKETVDKALKMTPEKALTGPAKRGDMTTIRNHEALLISHPEEQKIYQLLTDYILNKYRK